MSHFDVSNDSGLLSFVVLARFHQVDVQPSQIYHEYGRDGKYFNKEDILLAAKGYNFKAKLVKSEMERLAYCPLPAIACGIDNSFFIIAKIENDKCVIHDPLVAKTQIITLDELKTRFSGELILCRAESSTVINLMKFDFSWFIPSIIKHRKLFGEVLLSSFVLQILGLLTPLFFQVVMDKVLVHRGLTTLDVLVIGLLVVNLAEFGLSTLRSYVFTHTTSKIDVELGSRLFKHLLNLPLAYFVARRVGDSVARVRELENIRSFLTGNTITILLDVLFTVVFLVVMFFYSKWLTLVVVLSLPLYALLALIITPILRIRLQEKFSRGAENQAFLVESINGIDTLKAMAVEPQTTRKWDDQLAKYVSASFKTQVLSTIANEGVSLIGKLVTVVTLWLGARLVITGELTVGQLIAFNMLAGRVAQPIMRIANLYTDFQQIGISMQRLGDILNSSIETTHSNRTVLPPIKGSISLDKVHFRYLNNGKDILNNVSFIINPGEVIGIVGRSGSGKSTITKLIQRLYSPTSGRILVDGIDLAQIDVSSLRRQIGVVLQENMLFNRSIKDNIALINTGMTLEQVIYVARLAGAHDFILELPEGYDTVVGEHGSSLSGGQKQRIAIARALIGNPRILIFDEATSALDYESEFIIAQNMQSICKGRTVIIIAHRLSAVKKANKILVMDKGQIIEVGNHNELIKKNGHYAYLYNLQQQD